VDWNCLKLPRITSSGLELLQVACDCVKCTWIASSCLGLRLVDWNCLKLPGIASSVLELPQVAWDCVKCTGIASSCLGLCKVDRNCLKLPGIASSGLGYIKLPKIAPSYSDKILFVILTLRIE
jgi:hypothetical protein